jgi:hypothetical protein
MQENANENAIVSSLLGSDRFAGALSPRGMHYARNLSRQIAPDRMQTVLFSLRFLTFKTAGMALEALTDLAPGPRSPAGFYFTCYQRIRL